MACERFDYDILFPIVHAAARRAARRYGTEPDEELGEANVIYAGAANDYDPRRSPPQHFLRKRLLRLANKAKVAAKRRRILSRVYCDLFSVADPGDWTDRLSDDGWFVLRLAAASRPGMTPGRIRRGLKAYLRAVLWDEPRIDAAFENVRGNLP